MEAKDFNPKWAISKNDRKPVYVSSDKLLVAYDYFMKAIPISGSPATYYINPKMCTRSICTLPELGEVAQTHRFLPQFVTIDHYPEMSDPWGHSGLKTDVIEDWFEMSFLGAEYFVLANFKLGYRFELWNWKVEKLEHSVSTPPFRSESACGDVQVHPLRWYQAALQSNTRVIMLEIKTSKDHIYLEMYFYFIEDDAGILSFRRASNTRRRSSTLQENLPPKPCLTLQCFCWLTENKIIIATSGRVYKAGLGDLTLLKLGDLEANVVSIVRKDSNLYVAFETGLIKVVSIVQDKWDVRHVISVGQSLEYACLSPNSKYLTVTTQGNNINNIDVDGNIPKPISKVSETKFSDIIDVGFLGPILSHCAVAEKSGALHIINEADGSIVSTIRIEEEISSMASSPLCSYVAIGSNFGFIYFVDCTVFTKPRIVLCEKPYDLPIQILKFDNFGRFIVTSSENQVIKIWSAVPSSNFALLGSVTMASMIIDVTAFCRRVTEGTFVFVLTENESKTGVLSRLLLPKDFGSSFKYYQKDSFGTLSTDALDMRDLELGRPFMKVEIHSDLGALLSSSPGTAIYRVNPWKNIGFENAFLLPLVTPKDAHNWCLSLDQDWIATVRKEDVSQAETVTTRERIELHSTAHVTKNGSASFVTVASDWTGESCLKFSHFSNSLICGKRTGDVVSCQWTSKSISVPEWLIYCFSHFEAENEYLKSMVEEQPTCVSQKSSTITDSSPFKGKELHFLEACISVINFKMDSIGEREFADETFQFTAASDHLYELSSSNRKKLSQALAEMIPDDVKMSLNRVVEDQLKNVSSINGQITIEDYSKASIRIDQTLAENLDIGEPGNKDRNKTPRFTLDDVVKSKCKADSLSVIRNLLKSICDHKIAFNAEFDIVYGKSQEVSFNVEQSHFLARKMSQRLPSKAERDFWTAFVENPSVFFASDVDNNNENSESSGLTLEPKRSIVDQLRSSSVIQQTFDSFVDDLRFMKQYSDFIILASEMKIYAILLFTAIEEDLSNCKILFESSNEDLDTNVMELRFMENEISSLRGAMKRMFEKLLRYERSLSMKLESKCSDMNLPETVFDQIKDQIELGLDRFIQDHKSSQSLSIDPESVPLELEDFTERFECPSAVPKSVSENVRNLQTCLLALSILWCNLKGQLLFVADTMEMSYDYYHKIGKSVEEIDQALELLSALVSSSFIKFQSVMGILDEVTSTNEDVIKVQGRMSLNSLPAQDHKMWTDIDRKTSRMLSMKQQLKEIGVLYDRIKGLNSDILIRSQCSFEHSKFMENINRRFEEARQAFNIAKSVRKEYVDKRKNSALKFLKSD